MTILDNHTQHTQNDVFVAYKNEGETPLGCLNRLKDEGFLPFNDKFTYAGRLDPLAQGLIIFLRGEAIKNKDDFLSLNKEYEVEVLLGISTDTGDILGLINSIIKGDVVFDLKNIETICESFIGEIEVPYPWFSSKTFKGKPLFEWAKEFASEEDGVGQAGQGLEEGEEEMSAEKKILSRPFTKLSIKEIEFLDMSLISEDILFEDIIKRIKKVNGDFRQEKILHGWDKVFAKKTKGKARKTKSDPIQFPILKIRVKCASGSYMRTLAELIGEKLKVPSLAYSIKRISIGEYRM
jgi:tRNA U55 pseudouridine synthase TruB